MLKINRYTKEKIVLLLNIWINNIIYETGFGYNNIVTTVYRVLFNFKMSFHVNNNKSFNIRYL